MVVFLGGQVPFLGCGYYLMGELVKADKHACICEPHVKSGGKVGGGVAWSLRGERGKPAGPRVCVFLLLLQPVRLRLQTGGPRLSVAHRCVLIGLCCV